MWPPRTIDWFGVREKWASRGGTGRVGGERARISDKHTKAQRPEREDGWEGRGRCGGVVVEQRDTD